MKNEQAGEGGHSNLIALQVYLLQKSDGKYCLIHGYGTFLRKAVDGNLKVDDEVVLLQSDIPQGALCLVAGALKLKQHQLKSLAKRINRIYPIYCEVQR
jgi:hypothetical protein